MPSRILPGLGLTAYWDLGSNGWNVEHDPDTRLVSVLCQCRVLSRSTTLPLAPSGGEVLIAPIDDPTNPNDIALWDDSAWVYLVPQDGFLAYVVDEQQYVRWDAGVGSWVAMNVRRLDYQSASYVLVANMQPGTRVRMDVATANTVTVPDDSTVLFPEGFWFEVEQVGAGVTSLVAGGTSTINTPETLALRKQRSVCTLMKVGPDEWTLSGDIDPI